MTTVPRPNAASSDRKNLSDAQSILHHHGRTFHLASRLLAPAQRDRAARLYAFCRYTDDLADCASDPFQARTRLQALRRSILQRNPQCLESARLLDLTQEVPIPISATVALIDGALNDVTSPIFQTERELIRYSFQVAGTVGLMMCPVLDVADRKAWPQAIDLGIGMQLTNIARDIAEDARSGRIYLPTDWTGLVQPETLVDPDPRQASALAGGIKRLLDLAERYYDSGMAGLHYLPFRARLGIHAAARMYRHIGRQIARNDYRSWTARTVVSSRRKLWLAAFGVTAEALSMPPREAGHDERLHDHLDAATGARPSTQ